MRDRLHFLGQIHKKRSEKIWAYNFFLKLTESYTTTSKKTKKNLIKTSKNPGSHVERNQQ